MALARQCRIQRRAEQQHLVELKQFQDTAHARHEVLRLAAPGRRSLILKSGGSAVHPLAMTA
jgi:hypothetical protein